MWRGGLGSAYRLPALSSAGASLAGGPAVSRGKAERNLSRRSDACILPPSDVRAVVCFTTPITSVVPSAERKAVVNSWPPS